MSKVSFFDKVKFITGCYEASGRVKGWFTGDSYQFHPHGFCLNGVLIYDHHNVHGYYTIQVCDTPDDARFYPAQFGRDASTSWGARALPEFVNGQTTVWSSGNWTKDGPWKTKIEELVDHLYKECKKAVKTDKAEKARQAKLKEEANQNKDKQLAEAWS